MINIRIDMTIIIDCNYKNMFVEKLKTKTYKNDITTAFDTQATVCIKHVFFCINKEKKNCIVKT